MSYKAFMIADRAYRDLLKVPFDDYFRVVNQPLYAALRDAIASYLKQDSETVQTRYEASGNGVESLSVTGATEEIEVPVSVKYQPFKTGAAGKENG